MTTPTPDPAIEQEAARMLKELQERCIRGRGPSYSSGSTEEILRNDMFRILRELATLRRGAAKAVEPGEIEYCASVPACALSSQQLAELRKWWDAFGAENTPAAILKMVNELLELRCDLAALRSRGGEGEQWIPCSEKLPGADDVLAFSQGLFAVASWHADKQLWDIGEGWCASVTHWMPLPLAPKAVPNG